MDVGEQMRRVPPFDRFPRVDETHAELDELRARYPHLVRLRRIGTSRLGEPLRVLTVDGGPRDALVIGGPHPNEPIGSLTAGQLVRRLCEDAALREELGLRWHVIPCVDPDGARLNEGWFAHPGDRRRYARHFYRPAWREQVEWTFPIAGDGYTFQGGLPETEALARLMDEVRPAFVYSLHNGEYSGAFFYINRSDPALAARLAALPAREGIPLHHGEPEMPDAQTVATAVYLTPGGARQARAFGAGGGSADYAARFGALHLITELPYWADERVGDTTATATPYAEVLKTGIAAQRELVDVMGAAMAAVRRDLRVPSPFHRSTEDMLKTYQDFADAWEGLPGTDRPATVAETFGNRQTVHMRRLRLAGTFCRALDAEAAAGNLTRAVRAQRARVREVFESWCDEAEAESGGRPIAIRSLVAVQLAAGLAAAGHARG
ncbi:M14 family zinc carboxypeptidase [Sphaerisporangium sp. TRM90804]|uniref:M14 family zinc carboxypeptidase n=1 Tax=Sphaerisporangium sp. TRM90804 TaxID=3031113 RepID=UPI0024470503|nr:M14 family zinc carboxypeptidase [Sphaerisporangium sp. TRM90804]MDH2428201.1 M14 family zinc carboxypeptidase [Sphaerisporangium sp. TRM90804]